MAPEPQIQRILSVRILTEKDIIVARRRARQLATLLGFTAVEQAALSTAVSEVARNAVQYAGGGSADFGISLASPQRFLWVDISDRGPGVGDVDAILGGRYISKTGLGLGLAGSRRLTDSFSLTSSPTGTRVRMGKALPDGAGMVDISSLTRELASEPEHALLEEIHVQNRDLLQTLESLRARDSELLARQAELQRLNVELEETNRGVVALYAELEERNVALRRASELKSQFLSHVSHEFRTPVNSIMALTHLLLRRADGDLSTEQEKQVTFIRQAADGLTEMVNDLLDLAKVEAGKTDLRMGKVEVSGVLGAVRALMRPLATNEAVALVFEDPMPHLALESDEAKLGQILRNLVSNALKFTERGEVRVKARPSGLDAIVFSVSDTGIGIAPENLELVFEEFAQIHHSMQRSVKGTGLGLPLSRKLAQALGGSLVVTSQLGRGSTFVLTLPVRKDSGLELVRSDSPQAKDGTILVVDDEEAVRYLVRQMFRGSSYRLIESNALEAAERARFERPQLILLDLIMPGRTGFEVLDELKSDPMTQDIPVVIHTSKPTTPADLYRLGDRHSALLPKSGSERKKALEAIRAILEDPSLFVDEPEFETRPGGGSKAGV